MSPKVKYAIAGALALVMLVCLTGYADNNDAPTAIANEGNAGSYHTEAQTAGTIGTAPNAVLVGINVLEIKDAPETGALTEIGRIADETVKNAEEAGGLSGTEAEEPDAEGEAAEPVMMKEEKEIPSAYDGIAVVTINEAYLRVRSDATTESETIGRMYPGSAANIVGTANGWYHIQSGNVDGWISCDYAVTGREAELYVKNNMEAVVTVTTDVLRVREEADVESAFLDYVKLGQSYSILGEENGWYLIEFKPGKTGYVSGEYVRIGANLGNAMTLTEAEAYERQKELEEKAERIGAELRGKITVSEDEIYLLAALCRHEAGADSYEASLAVANVVINRMKNGYWGYGMSEVIYSPGQFQYVENGVLDQYLSSPGSNCLQAARDAVDGLNNIGSYLFFRSAKSAVYSEYSSWVDIGGNVFYRK